RISSWLEADVPTRLPDRVLHATFERTRKSSQHRSSRALLGSVQVNRTWAAVAGAALVVVAVAGWGLGAGQPGVGGVPATPTADASPIATATPTVRAKASFVVARPGEGRSLGWSRDGTRLLLQKGDGNLFVVHADGSETQVTDQLSRLQAIPGSS